MPPRPTKFSKSKKRTTPKQGERPKPARSAQQAAPKQQAKAKAKASSKATAEKPKRTPKPNLERRALSHVGGQVDFVGGDEATRASLRAALSVSSDENATRPHIHGFHSYPARLHPETAAKLIEGFSKPGDTVLDPFCGSGTILVEAHRLGRAAIGVDANPLAVRLARFKVTGDPEPLLSAARSIAEHADERRKAKAKPTLRYPQVDLELFDRHVLLELDSLRDGIRNQVAAELQEPLALILSSLLTKLSKQPGDTASARGTPRLASGFAIRSFVRRTEEVVRQLKQYRKRVQGNAPARFAVGDARKLGRTLDASSVHLVVSSPPYPGVYDYVEHHTARLRWLDLDAKAFARREIGSRRELGQLTPAEGLERWREDFSSCLEQLRRALAPTGTAALVIADSVFAGSPLYVEDWLAELATASGLELQVLASQKRPHFHKPTSRAFQRRPRREHVALLRPVAGNAGPKPKRKAHKARKPRK